MLSRLGSALVLLGLIALTVFLVTFPSGQPDLRALLVGAGLAIVGLALRRRGAASTEERPVRFRTLRKVLGKRPPDHDEA